MTDAGKGWVEESEVGQKCGMLALSMSTKIANTAGPDVNVLWERKPKTE